MSKESRSSVSLQQLSKFHSKNHIPVKKNILRYQETKTQNRYKEFKKTQPVEESKIPIKPVQVQEEGLEAFHDPLFDDNFNKVNHKKRKVTELEELAVPVAKRQKTQSTVTETPEEIAPKPTEKEPVKKKADPYAKAKKQRELALQKQEEERLERERKQQELREKKIQRARKSKKLKKKTSKGQPILSNVLSTLLPKIEATK